MIDFIAATGAALLSGMGVGSGGLLVIYLTLVTGAQQIYAQGINLLFFLFSSGVAMLVHLSKRKIYTGVVATLALAGLFGSIIGCTLSTVLDATVIQKLFGAMLIFSGMASVYPKKQRTHAPGADFKKIE